MLHSFIRKQIILLIFHFKLVEFRILKLFVLICSYFYVSAKNYIKIQYGNSTIMIATIEWYKDRIFCGLSMTGEKFVNFALFQLETLSDRLPFTLDRSYIRY